MLERLFGSAGPCLMVSALAAGPTAAQGQCPFDWFPGEGAAGIMGGVLAATAWDPDGAGPQPELLVVGGTFRVAGGVIANNVAAWDGSAWQPLGSGMSGGFPTQVLALAVYNGELIAGGYFRTAGGASANAIARWDGTAWQPL